MQTFNPATNSPFGVQSKPNSIATGDFDGDGDLDLVTANNESNNVSVLLNDGQGNFSDAPSSPVGVGSNPLSVVVGDLNQDGKLDLVTADTGPNFATPSTTISVCFGNGDGTFNAAININAGKGPAAIGIADFNLDNYQDLVVINLFDNKASVLAGNGLGNFSLVSEPEVAGSANNSISVGDFNNDGKPDFITGGVSSDVFLLLGDGTNNFQPRQNISTGVSFANAGAVGDVNKDGNLDLVVGSSAGMVDKIAVLLGNGDGSFAAPNQLTVEPGSHSIALNDFDGDTNLDIALTSRGSNKVSLLLGNGKGDFVASGKFDVGTAPSSIAVGDFNSDGKPDIATANTDSNNVSVLLGTTVPGIQINSVSSAIANGNYAVGQIIPIAITFSDPVKVTGTPKLTLNTGGTAIYNSGSDTNTLIFNYTVAAGEQTNDLDYTNSTALDLNGGTILDTANNPATLTLPVPGSANSLGINKDIAVNYNYAPTDISLSATSVEENSANGKAIATLTATDPTPGDTHTYALINDAEGRFQIQGDKLQVANSTLLNFEAANSHNISIQVTDSGGEKFTKDVTIDLIDINEAPVVAEPLIDKISSKNIPLNFNFSDTAFQDPDAGDSLTYSATLSDGKPLPSWLNFNPVNRTFSGTPTETGNFNIAVQATDKGLLNTSSTFKLEVLDDYTSFDLIEGIDTTLSQLENNVYANLLSHELPLAGGQLKSVFPSFINDLRNDINLKLKQYNTIKETDVKSILQDALASKFPSLKIDEFLSKDESTYTIHLNKDYQREMPFSAGFGLPALGIKAEGKGDANFKYDLSLSFGLNKQQGFFVDTNNTHLKVDTGVGLDNNFHAQANLGFFQLDLTNNTGQPTNLDAQLQVNVKDIGKGTENDNKLTLQELKSDYQLKDIFDTTLDSKAKLALKAVTSIDGNPALPSFNFDLNADFAPVTFKDGEWNLQKPQVKFQNMQLDLGSFINNFAKPVITKVNEVVKPALPIINALNSDIKPLSEFGVIRNFFDQNRDGKVNLIEAGATIARKQIDTRFLDALDKIGKAGNLLNGISPQDGKIPIDLDDYALDFDATDPNADITNANTEKINQASATPVDQAKSQTGNSKIGQLISLLQSMDGLSMPIFSDPKTAINLLMGKPDVTLFSYKVPKLDFNFSIDKEFPIYSIPVVKIGVNGKVKGDFEAKANFGFGFDTSGLAQWKASGFNADDAYKVLDGFYVSDRQNADGTGPDLNELKLKAGIAVGGGVNIAIAKAFLTGGIQANAKLDLLDVGEETGTSDGKIHASEITSRISNPLNLFEVNGDVKAALDFKAEYWTFWDGWETAYQKRLGEIKIADFRLGTGSTRRSRAIDGYITGATVFLDANFNGVQDDSEPFAFTNPDGSFDFTVELEKFDSNQNGEIDYNEGKIILKGGIDTATYLPLITPLASTPESTVITPLTTLVAELAEQNIDPLTAEIQVKAALGISPVVDLANYDPLEDISKNDASGVAVFAPTIQVQNIIVQTAKFIDGVSELPIEQIGNATIAAIANQIKAGTLLDLSQPQAIQTIVQSAIFNAKSQESQLNDSKLYSVITDVAQAIAEGNKIVQDLATSGRPPIEVATDITRLQAVAQGESAVALEQLAAGTIDLQTFVSENTGAGLQEKMGKVNVNDPTLLPDAQPTQPENPIDPNAENIIQGTHDDDILIGTERRNIIYGFRGNDRISGGIDNDTIYSGKGNDIASGSGGDDKIFGNIGDDAIAGGEGNDWMNGNQGVDNLDGNEGDDTIYGGKDNDNIAGSQGADVLYGDLGVDSIAGGDDNDILCGNRGDDTVIGGNGNDTLYGGKENDLLSGDEGDDLLFGDLGDDTLIGGNGKDRFALQTNAGVEAIADFKQGEDLIALTNSLTFEQLKITQDNGITSIKLLSNEQLLATIQGIQPNPLVASDFALI